MPVVQEKTEKRRGKEDRHFITRFACLLSCAQSARRLDARIHTLGRRTCKVPHVPYMVILYVVILYMVIMLAIPIRRART